MAKTAPIEKKPKKIGRPSSYNEPLAKEICTLIASGMSLRAICRKKGMPNAHTVLDWAIDNRYKEFHQQYARARAIQAELIVEEVFDIADDGTNDYMTIEKGDNTYNVEDKEVTNRSKLRVDTRKWYVSKVLPKKYGDKLDVTTDGKPLPIPILGGQSVKKQ